MPNAPLRGRTAAALTLWAALAIGVAQPSVAVASRVAAGEAHSCAVRSSGAAMCWGSDFYGQATVPAGLGTGDGRSPPANATRARSRRPALAACWGVERLGPVDDPGRPGDRRRDRRRRRAHVRGQDVRQRRLLGLRRRRGRRPFPGDLGTVTAIAAGTFHTCAIRTIGDRRRAGARTARGRRRSPPASAPCTAIAAGRAPHVRDQDQRAPPPAGARTARGRRRSPPGLGTVTAIAAGRVHTCAVKTDGHAVCWGWTATGQTTIPAGLGTVAAIAAGGYRTCAIRTDGTVACWGADGSGQARPGGIWAP